MYRFRQMRSQVVCAVYYHRSVTLVISLLSQPQAPQKINPYVYSALLSYDVLLLFCYSQSPALSSRLLSEQPLRGPCPTNTNHTLTVLTPSSLLLNHFMCSQSGNIQDLNASSDHSNSCIIETDSDPDNSSSLPRPGLAHPLSLPSDMGLRYLTFPATDDVR